MNTILTIAIGVLASASTIAALRLTGMDRDRASAPIILAAIAVFYPVFAAQNGTVGDVLLHGGVAGAFVAVAIVGHRVGLAILGAGLIVHGLFDVGMSLVPANPAPPFWPVFCLTFDVVLGGWWLLTPDRTAKG